MDNPLEHFPQSIQDLADVVGIDGVLKIVEARGGIWLYVPRKANDDHWLARLIGFPALQQLVKIYAGEEIEIPRCAKSLKRAKDLEIANGIKEGASGAQLARQHHYTERGIRKVKRRLKERGEIEEQQGDLF
ncbi:hypothetical protein BOW53_02890 [Solemya pervernicosa gill symbiont]|uniref:Mor transcription activator domain-containing protein n=1 Tax=Solemya pervernicosa gill symbiont TaxID=642797 RepID=A0A1T2L9D4_9GAMM|nr:Mor transcription activator family protein [Solemya pervernicosa gill symbiont]OOZ41642.1 hypothetical protein BOW53_02890 [Solemya pervernicosa gill symbiont]